MAQILSAEDLNVLILARLEFLQSKNNLLTEENERLKRELEMLHNPSCLLSELTRCKDTIRQLEDRIRDMQRDKEILLENNRKITDSNQSAKIFIHQVEKDLAKIRGHLCC